MAELVMSDEVRALLGAEMIDQIAVHVDAGASCVGCPDGFDTSEAVSVLVLRAPTGAHIGYAHTRCAPSGLVDVPDSTLDAAEQDDETSMDVRAALLDYARGVAPALICEVSTRAFMRSGPHGEVTNVVVAVLLRQGWTLVRRLREAPRRPPAGWSATLSLGAGGATHLHILDATGDLFYLGRVDAPDEWLRAVQHYGWCVLYAGAVATPAGDDPRGTFAALRAAAASGGLVAARVPVAVHPS